MIKKEELKRCCGLCSSHKFSGSQQGAREHGSCVNFIFSGRPSNNSNAEACDYFRRKSAKVLRSEEVRAELLKSIVAGVNRTSKGRAYRG